MKASEIVQLIKKAEFRSFSKMDFDAYCGVETDDPMIAEIDGQYALILDGEDLHIINADPDEEFLVTLIATNIHNTSPFVPTRKEESK